MDPLRSISQTESIMTGSQQPACKVNSIIYYYLKMNFSLLARRFDMNEPAWRPLQCQLSVSRQMWPDSTRRASSCPLKLWNLWTLVLAKIQSSNQGKLRHCKKKKKRWRKRYYNCCNNSVFTSFALLIRPGLPFNNGLQWPLVALSQTLAYKPWLSRFIFFISQH